MTTSPPLDPHAFQLADPGEVNQVARLGQPELHHRNEAMPAGEQSRLAVKPTEQGHSFAEGRGTMVFERTRDQAVLPRTKLLARSSRNREDLQGSYSVNC